MKNVILSAVVLSAVALTGCEVDPLAGMDLTQRFACEELGPSFRFMDGECRYWDDGVLLEKPKTDFELMIAQQKCEAFKSNGVPYEHGKAFCQAVGALL